MTGKEIKAIRKAAGMDIYQFAAKCGVRPVTVWAWERGQNRPGGAAVVCIEMIRDATKKTPA